MAQLTPSTSIPAHPVSTLQTVPSIQWSIGVKLIVGIGGSTAPAPTTPNQYWG